MKMDYETAVPRKVSGEFDPGNQLQISVSEVGAAADDNKSQLASLCEERER